MRSRLVLSLAAAAAGLAGCATPGGGFSCPAAGGPAWHVASSRGFEVWTDAGAEVAGKLAADLERLQGTLAADLERMQAARVREVERLQVAWAADLERLPLRRGGSLGRVRVVLLSDRAQLAELTGPGVSGFITTRTDPPTIVVDAGRALKDHSVLAHELAHHLVERWLVRPPRWLDEGLAEHLETAGAPAVVPGTVGSTPSWSRGGWRPEPGFVRRLLAWDGRLDPAEPRRHSSEAWALVHFLVNEEPARLAAYLDALEAGRPAAAAFDLVFPEWSPRHLLGAYLLEARVVAFLDEGRHRTTSYPDLASARADVSVRPAASADLHLLRLELPRRERRPVEAVRAEVDAALLEDPGHPEALRWRAQLDGLAPLPLALAAVEAHPRDWRAWRFLAGALPPEGEDLDREAALRRALTLAPDRPELLRSLAQHLAGRGRHAEAASLARLAAELAPWDPAVVAVYASVALTLRACPVDRVAASRAAALRVEPTLDPERRGLARALDALEQRCELARFAEAASAPAWAMAGSP